MMWRKDLLPKKPSLIISLPASQDHVSPFVMSGHPKHRMKKISAHPGIIVHVVLRAFGGPERDARENRLLELLKGSLCASRFIVQAPHLMKMLRLGYMAAGLILNKFSSAENCFPTQRRGKTRSSVPVRAHLPVLAFPPVCLLSTSYILGV